MTSEGQQSRPPEAALDEGLDRVLGRLAEAAKSLPAETAPDRGAIRLSPKPPWLLWAQPRPTRLVLLGDAEPVWFHWGGEQIALCRGPGCQLCPDPRRREYGFFPAIIDSQPSGTYCRVVLELPPAAFCQLRDRDCRGLIVEVQRLSDSRVRLRVLGAESRALPSTFDVQPVLDAKWGIGPSKPAIRLYRRKA